MDTSMFMLLNHTLADLNEEPAQDVSLDDVLESLEFTSIDEA